MSKWETKKPQHDDADHLAFDQLREAFTRIRNGDKNQETIKKYRDALKKLGLLNKYGIDD